MYESGSVRKAVVGAAALVVVATAAACGSASDASVTPPPVVSTGGSQIVEITHSGAGPTPTQPIDQAEMGAWLCETQAIALEQLMPRIPAAHTDLQTRAARVLAWFHNKCSPQSADRDAEWVDLFHELNALPIPTPVVSSVAAARGPN